jgi:hypothetical protein
VTRRDLATGAGEPVIMPPGAPVDPSSAIRVWVADGLVWVTDPGAGPGLNFCAAPGTGPVLARLRLPQGGTGTLLAIGGRYLYYLPGDPNLPLTPIPIPAACRAKTRP